MMCRPASGYIFCNKIDYSEFKDIGNTSEFVPNPCALSQPPNVDEDDLPLFVNKSGSKNYLKEFRKPVSKKKPGKPEIMNNKRYDDYLQYQMDLSNYPHIEEYFRKTNRPVSTEQIDYKPESLSDDEDTTNPEIPSADVKPIANKLLLGPQIEDTYLNTIRLSLECLVKNFEASDKNTDFKNSLNRKSSLRKKKDSKPKCRCFEYKKLENKILKAIRTNQVKHCELNLVLKNGKNLTLMSQ